MAEDIYRGAAQPDASAALLTAALAGGSDNVRVDELLDRQVTLAELQIADLRREDRIRHRNLRIRHISDLLKVTFEVSMAFIGLAIALMIGSAIWNAAHEDGLVIEAFAVPPDMAQRGLNGQVVAAQLQDKLAAMQDATDSARPAASYSNNWGDDIKVEIPNTGISIGEFYRYLASWLGNQTHISGEVFRTAGGIAVTARVGGDGGATATGAEADLDSLLQQAAESIYERTQPYRYAVFLGGTQQRLEKGMALLQKLTVEGSPVDRVWAHIGLGSNYEQSDPARSPEEQHKAAALDPALALPWQNLVTDDGVLGHDEEQLADGRTALDLLQNDNGEMSARARRISLPMNQGAVAFMLGDFATALGYHREATTLPNYAGIAGFASQQIVLDLALLHQNSAARKAWHDLPVVGDPGQRSFRAGLALSTLYAMEDWPAVASKRQDVELITRSMAKVPGFTQKFVDVTLTRTVWPMVAVALAMNGDFRGAHALIDKTPLDCYICVRSRGKIAAAEMNWNAAGAWFARAVEQAPSIPLAYYDWGRMLMAKGDFAGAIEKFSLAHDKGPHFADAIETWGEALLAQKTPGDAMDKFEEANQYTPKWGRLHMKWGEALLANGEHDEALKQFAIAAQLDLSQPEKVELARVRLTPG